MDRRKFGTLVSTGALSLSMMGSAISEETIKSKTPGKVPKGSKIGLIAPASAIHEDRIVKAKENIESLGFKVVEGKYLRARYGYLAGKDFERVEDIHEMYRNPEIKAIWCVRGGYGCTRILDQLDYQLIKKNKKPLVGFSDITALHNAIFKETGIMGLHGPVASSDFNEYNVKSLIEFLSGKDQVNLDPFPLNEDSEELIDPIEILNDGPISGILTGGNLSLLSSMIGTKYAINYRNKVVLIEDIGEEPYRIDRMLTQLINGSDIGKARGILLGQFKGCNPKNPEMSLSLKECLKDRLLPLNIPVVYGLNFGHVEHNFTFPIGAEATFNMNNFQLSVNYK